MSIDGWYYLHKNGSLIYKRELGTTAADIRESPFARAMWPCDPEDREMGWSLLVEALALGADKERIKELAEKWHCTDEDGRVYAERVCCDWFMDGDAFCAVRRDFVNLQESPAGFGASLLEAMASLAKELGYKGGKMWNATFKDLCQEGAKP